MTDVYQALTAGLLEEIRTKTSFCAEPKSEGVVATNFQGAIHITFLPYGVHVLKLGYADHDAVFDYEDPQLFEKIIAKINYLQDIPCHIKNAEITKWRLAQKKVHDQARDL